MIVPGQYDFDLYIGADLDQEFQILDDSGAPIAFTGYTPRFVAKEKLTDTETVFDFSGSPHLIFGAEWWLTLSLAGGDSADLKICCLNYSISLINNSDPNDVIAYMDGIINCKLRADSGV